MTDAIQSLPHPVTVAVMDELEASGPFTEVLPEVLAVRWTEREGHTQVIPALILKTRQSTFFAVVENDSKDGYRLLSRGDTADESQVYDDLADYCDKHYPDH